MAIISYYLSNNITIVSRLLEKIELPNLLNPNGSIGGVLMVDNVREMLGIPPLINLSPTNHNNDRLVGLNQRILSVFKFYTAPQNTPFVESHKFPSIANSGFNDIKYLKNTNSILRWYLTDDILP